MAQKVQKYTETGTYQCGCRGNRAGMAHTNAVVNKLSLRYQLM